MSNNIYPVVQLDKDDNQFLKLKFIILEKDWPYPNFELQIQLNDPVMFLFKELENRHGGIVEVRMWLDADKINEINLSQFNAPINKVIPTAKGGLEASPPTLAVYYDFKNAENSPIQLF